jgi:hypothetical protein
METDALFNAMLLFGPDLAIKYSNRCMYYFPEHRSWRVKAEIAQGYTRLIYEGVFPIAFNILTGNKIPDPINLDSIFTPDASTRG